MSNNVYGPQNGPAPDFLRNTYDKQFQNLITTNFGELRPCFCKEVLPGDSVNIDPVVAIRSQPIVFPIQTRMKFYCHFFYGRNRILMKNWEDFIFKTKDGIVPPLLKLNSSRAKKMISTGSLGDNLGVPSTVGLDGSVQGSITIDPESIGRYGDGRNSTPLNRTVLSDYLSSLVGLSSFPRNKSYINAYFEGFSTNLLLAHTKLSNVYTSVIPEFFTGTSAMSGNTYMFFTDSAGFPLNQSPIFISMIIDSEKSTYTIRVEDHIDLSTLDIATDFKIWFVSINSNGEGNDMSKPGLGMCVTNYHPFFALTPTSSDFMPSTLSFSYDVSGVFDSTDDSFIGLNKFVGLNPQIPISALPFRLYEFICNYYYRNDTNNPYMLDGEPQYNRFIPSTDDGWDENEYLLHKRNWESDMFTTAVPSPQFGTAPLVGLTYNGGLTADVTTNVTDSDGQTKQLSIKVGVDDEGNINNIFNADTAVPSGSLKALMDAMSTTGISINTLRNVNSFQRFLENVIRRGLRYRNQLLSHFGVSVDYPDIDIPQFIGGFSGDLVVRDVTNMAESAEVALGDVAGKIDAVIQSNHSINCYCAEHGFIMGIFCIVPVPTYSQVLPHMFTRYDAFDYFQKEFDKIGYVPVTYRNFLPLQADNPDEVFGYQRAWFEYMSSLDEVHGDFRMSLDDFVLYRIFKDKPTLNEEFLTVDSDSLNNIFAVDKVEEKYKNSDKFLCQFYFQYSQKTMIPKHGVASLE